MCAKIQASLIFSNTLNTQECYNLAYTVSDHLYYTPYRTVVYTIKVLCAIICSVTRGISMRRCREEIFLLAGTLF